MTSLLDAPWRQWAACRGADPALFFAATNAEDRGRRLRTLGDMQRAQALAYCARCHVRDDCLDHAIRFDELGIWGGTTQRERARMRRALVDVGVDLPSRPEAELLPRSTPTGADYPAQCGTARAYRRHVRNGEEPCPACRIAANAEWRAARSSRGDR